MQDDLRRGLLPNKFSSFQKLYEQGLARIQRIKQRNDYFQKQIGNQLQHTQIKQIQNQIKFIENQIKQLKHIMDQIQLKFKDPQSKNKLKNLKLDAQKQTQRNKIILKDLLSKSFNKNDKNHHDDEEQHQYIQGGKKNVSYQDNNNHNHQQHNPNQKNSLISSDQNYITQHHQIDLQLQRDMIKQRNQLLNQVQQTTMRVNQMMSQTAGMVNDQGKQIDVIGEHIFQAHEKVVQTNVQLVQASTLQKKSRKKYICFAIIIIIGVCAIVGLVLIFSGGKK